MRDVQVIDASAETTRAHHVIGVDESGNVTGPGPFALAAVRSPRESGERLAELLIQHGLSPWMAKSQSLRSKLSRQEHNKRVESLLQDLTEHSIEWYAAFGHQNATIHQKAAGVSALAKKTITGDQAYTGDSVLLPDGSPSMYGEQQLHLRHQAAQFFDGPFDSAFGSVYPSGLPKADLTYPEVAAADYIAGYVRDTLAAQEQSVSDFSEHVVWFDSNWREPSNVTPTQFYALRPATGQYGTVEGTRVVAWIKGRHPDGEDHDVSSQVQNAVEMLESETVQQYLFENILP